MQLCILDAFIVSNIVLSKPLRPDVPHYDDNDDDDYDCCLTPL